MPAVFGLNVINVVPPTGPIRLWDCQTEWARIEKQRGAYDFSLLDSLVNAAGKRSIMLVLGHPPAWAAKGGPDGLQASWMTPGSNRPPASMDDFKKYVNAVVTRYKGKIDCYQVWNEPADKRFYSGSWNDLGTIVKTAYKEIKRIDPFAKVISPPLQPRRQAGWSVKGAAIIKALNDAGLPFDIWSCHIYPQQGEGLDGFKRDCVLVKDAISGTKKPLWITESNYNLGGQGNPYPIRKQIGMKELTKTACTQLDIPRMYWYAYQYSNPALLAINSF